MSMVQRYQKRISGPLMDRIDNSPRSQARILSEVVGCGRWRNVGGHSPTGGDSPPTPSHPLCPLNKPHVLVNGDMGPAEMQMFCQLDETGKNLMCAAVQQMNLSARAYHRVRKLARTIADLTRSRAIEVPHLAEALQHWPKEVG